MGSIGPVNGGKEAEPRKQRNGGKWRRKIGAPSKARGRGGIPGLFGQFQKTKSGSSEPIGPILGHRVEGIGAKTFPSLIGFFGILLTLGKNR
jgi:hypothetical protein